jgi:hypothetical protein
MRRPFGTYFARPSGDDSLSNAALLKEGRTVLLWDGGRHHLLPDAVIPFTGLCR